VSFEFGRFIWVNSHYFLSLFLELNSFLFLNILVVEN